MIYNSQLIKYNYNLNLYIYLQKIIFEYGEL